MTRGQMEALGMATDWMCDLLDKREARIAELERDLESARILNEGTFRANKRLWDALSPDQRELLEEDES